MKNNNKNIEKIFDMLQMKNSAELNIEEVEIVKVELDSLNEFENMKLVSNASRQYLSNHESIIPDPQVLKSLKHEIKRNKSKKRNILTFSIPAYQAVAACVAIFMFSWMIFKSGNKIEPKEQIKYVTVEKIIIDTIKIAENAVPKIALKNAVNLLGSNTGIIKKTVNKIMKSDKPENNEPQNMFVGFRNLKHLDNQKRGINIADDSILRKFRFTILSRN
jgi:hypothetical protein